MLCVTAFVILLVTGPPIRELVLASAASLVVFIQQPWNEQLWISHSLMPSTKFELDTKKREGKQDCPIGHARNLYASNFVLVEN